MSKKDKIIQGQTEMLLKYEDQLRRRFSEVVSLKERLENLEYSYKEIRDDRDEWATGYRNLRERYLELEDQLQAAGE